MGPQPSSLRLMTYGCLALSVSWLPSVSLAFPPHSSSPLETSSLLTVFQWESVSESRVEHSSFPHSFGGVNWSTSLMWWWRYAKLHWSLKVINTTPPKVDIVGLWLWSSPSYPLTNCSFYLGIEETGLTMDHFSKALDSEAGKVSVSHSNCRCCKTGADGNSSHHSPAILFLHNQLRMHVLYKYWLIWPQTNFMRSEMLLLRFCRRKDSTKSLGLWKAPS